MDTNSFDNDSPPTTPLYEETVSSSPGYPSPGLDAQTDQTVEPLSAADASDGGGAKEKAATVKEEAKAVSDDAKNAAADVAGVTKDQAKRVGAEASSQAKELFGQATEELKGQASIQQKRVAEGLRAVGDELGGMADGSEDGGVAAELVRNLGDRADSVASWLDGRDPGSLLSEVKAFAARKPGTFIAIAAGAGLLAGRLSKSLMAANSADDVTETAGPSATPLAPARGFPSTTPVVD